MTNLNTIENVLPVVDGILENIKKYTGYTSSAGYFDNASFKEGGNVLTLFDHNDEVVECWYLDKQMDRGDLMTRGFLWYDLVSKVGINGREF